MNSPILTITEQEAFFLACGERLRGRCWAIIKRHAQKQADETGLPVSVAHPDGHFLETVNPSLAVAALTEVLV